MNQDWINALLGGVMIGGAVSLMLLWNGRVTGISGIINGALAPVKGDLAWRLLFIAGLVLGGFVLRLLQPDVFAGQIETGLGTIVAAGLLVGIGTVMGNGCTSGHGVCGISRLSVRSILATMTFIAAGIISVALFKKLGILP
ncbi:MAG TPA: YeeE/YedE family protein [Oligoflexus sp.]|uniref:YeeE/YedE family protein n=1 Tax=Oligoflexus sp. TaxID=1971216 RepID=UPI002D426E62|nr:YeeE/YedE family protein [Oligoflexus sp.]HYX36815.1 YeeE/YedE family protein [Oligoflexus sp.]